jgi:hypothetical protein
LHWRLDPIIEEYRRAQKTDHGLRIRLADGSLFAPREVIRKYMAADGRVIELNARDGPRLTGRVKAPSFDYSQAGKFSVNIRIRAAFPDKPRYAVGADGAATASPAEPGREVYRVVEDQDGRDVSGPDGPLGPEAAEQLLWLVQSSRPIPK